MEKVYTQEDALKGGPGLDGYAYRADVYCRDCARDIIHHVFEEQPAVTWSAFCDSEQVPQPIFFGESDCTQHCGSCGSFLYGGEQPVGHEPEPDPEEPEEGDLTTEDYQRWFQYGKMVVETGDDWKAELLAYMEQDKFWPNAWWISDHGNAHLLDLTKEAE